MSILRNIFFRMFSSMMRCCRGVASIEFVFVIPTLLIVMFGGVEIWSYIRADSRLSHAAGTLSDLVTRASEDISDDDMKNMFDAFNIIVRKERSDYSVHVRSVGVSFDINGFEKSDGNSNLLYAVQWSQADGSARTHKPCIELSMDQFSEVVRGPLIATAGDIHQTFIVIEAELTYSSPIGDLIADGTVISRSVVAAPRHVNKLIGPSGGLGCRVA